ncbi:MAG TPA: hypothetical protein PLT69_11650, partial [Deltaproteobacteria bacterium]|nr:hypothetical protein [Deltaproteobacteria bacterium]
SSNARPRGPEGKGHHGARKVVRRGDPLPEDRLEARLPAWRGHWHASASLDRTFSVFLVDLFSR